MSSSNTVGFSEEVLTQARVRHAHRSPELVELIAEARMKARLAAFDVLTPPNPEYRRLVSLPDAGV